MTTREDVIRIVEEARAQGIAPDLRNLDLRGLDLSRLDLRAADLRGADMRGVNLWNANLKGVNLSGTNMQHANMQQATLSSASILDADLLGADLRNADLRNANLRNANLLGVDMRCTALRGTNCFILQMDTLPSGVATFYPTPDGWYLQVGCWEGTLDELRDIIAKDDGWPGAVGEEIPRRRPLLEAAIALCEAHVAYYSNVVRELREKWGA